MRAKNGRHLPRRAALAAGLCLFALASFGAGRAAASHAQTRPPARAARALVISLDGLDARYLRDADKYGLRIPTLRRLMGAGAWARAGVVGVYPSVTYPSHTTLVTGARPARHGIFGNAVFEPPPQTPTGSWHWFAREVRADTLWQGAARRGLKTALVSWPVSTGAGDWNVPEIWAPAGTREETRERMRLLARPRGLLEEVARADPRLFAGVTADEGDDMRTRFAEYVIREKRPHVALVHLFDLDHFQHDYGPLTPEAFRMLEQTDAYVARLLAAAASAGTLDETAVFIVSDHGFRPVKKYLHPNVILERAGLLRWREVAGAGGAGRRVVSEWRALAYVNGGSASIILKDPRDRRALNRARVAFNDYTAMRDGRAPEDEGGLLRIVERRALDRLGADPRAAFALDAAEGYAFDEGHAAAPVTDATVRGQHGYLPAPAEYRAAFIASGAGVARRGDLGPVRMIDIGPTVAAALGLRLRHAEGRPLTLK